MPSVQLSASVHLPCVCQDARLFTHLISLHLENDLTNASFYTFNIDTSTSCRVFLDQGRRRSSAQPHQCALQRRDHHCIWRAAVQQLLRLKVEPREQSL